MVMATGSSLLVLFVAVWLSTVSGVPHHRREINGNGPLQNGLFDKQICFLAVWLSTVSGVPHHRREINGNGPLQNGLFDKQICFFSHARFDGFKGDLGARLNR
ncbi:hypothetical protein PS1_030952 [Malus domestica]